MQEVEIGSLEAPDKGSFKIGPFGSSLKVHEFVPSGIPVLGIENIHANHFLKRLRRFITKEKHRELSKYNVMPDDILVSTMGTIGRAAVVPKGVGTAIYDGHLFRMRTDTQKVVPKYLCYAINGYEGLLRQLKRESRGAIMDGLNTTILRECLIPLPSLPEQKRIAAILDKADRLRRQRRFDQTLSNSFLQSVFIKMFGDPFLNPHEWKTKTLRSVAEKISDGPFGSDLKSEHYQDSGFRVIRLQNIGVGEMIDNDQSYVSREHFEAVLSRHRCVPGDVIIGTMGEPNLRAMILPASVGEAMNKADCVQFRPNKSFVNSAFVCWLLNMPGTLTLASGSILGQTRSRISMGRVAELQLPIPPLPLQEKFASIVQKFERIRRQQREATRQAEHLFQTLLHRAFSGEL